MTDGLGNVVYEYDPLSRQTVNDNEDEIVAFVHRDALGLSGRSSNAGTGSAYNTHSYVAEEFDGLRNNVGIRGDLSRPPHEGGSMPTANDTITFDDVSMGDCELDGIIVPCSMARRALGSGAADIDWSRTNPLSLPRLGIMTYQYWVPNSGRTPPELPAAPDGVIRIDTQLDAGAWVWGYYLYESSGAPQQQTPQDSNQQAVDRAVQDVRDILSTDNACSRFLGLAREGLLENRYLVMVDIPRMNVEPVLDTLASQMTVGFLPGDVNNTTTGIRMRNTRRRPGTNYMANTSTNTPEYQAFGDVTVNIRGPFFSLRRIGNYAGNSRAGRALQILHELGHMIRTGGIGTPYLLSEDGGDQELSGQHTDLVESHCKDQLDALNRPNTSD
jgi:hypothetical protein